MGISERIYNKYYYASYLLNLLRKTYPYKLQFFSQLIKNRFKSKTILFYPEMPSESYIIYKICHKLGIKISNNPNKHFDLAICWEDVTYRKKNRVLQSIRKRTKVININCADISKSKVDKVFEEVFGYSISVNPLAFKGYMVVKPEVNGLHGGRIVKGPVKKKIKGYVYQKLVNNRIDDDCFEDLRTVIIKNKIVYVTLKLRQKETRFTDYYPIGFLASTSDVFSEVEIKKVLIFVKKMKLDFGELDIIRDSDEDKIYIVDVNNTVHGPPKGLLKNDYRLALKLAADEFIGAFL